MANAELLPASDAQVHRYTVVRRIIFLALAVAVIASLLVEFELPANPSEVTERIYRSIEALPEGSQVLFSFDFDPSSKGELKPMGVAVLRHCFKRGLHPVVMTFSQAGIGLHQNMLAIATAETGAQPGEDYVLLGFKPGDTNLILNMGENFYSAWDKDYYGNPTKGMPALEGLSTIKDFKYAVSFATGNTTEMWIAWGGDRFGIPLAAGCTAVIAPDLYIYLQSGQLDGLMGGLRGAADYEALVGEPDKAAYVATRTEEIYDAMVQKKETLDKDEDFDGGTVQPDREVARKRAEESYVTLRKECRNATKNMRAQSVVHLLIIGLVVIANIELFAARSKAGRK